MRSALLSTAAAIALSAPALASAQAPTAAAPDVAGADAATALDNVVVTANRSLTPLVEVGQSVTVLTQRQIQLDQETNVADMLARTPGLVLDRNGGPGGTTSVFIRGANANETVVLIDGVKVNDPSDAGTGYDFANLTTGDIARIEVLRGPQSTLYGGSAMGGVVNVVMAEATRPLQGDAQVEGGSYGTAYAKAAVGGKQDRLSWRLSGYYNSTDGVSSFDQAFGGKEADGYHTAGAAGRLGYELTPDVQFDERFFYRASRNSFDGFNTPTFSFGDDAEFGRTRSLIDYTGLNVSMLDGRLKNRFAFEYNKSWTRNFDPTLSPLQSYLGVGDAATLDYQGSFALARDYDLIFGAQHERSTFYTDSPYYDALYGETSTTGHATIDSGYAQLNGKVAPGLTLTGGVRYDSHSTFGSHATVQASAAWQVTPATILRASFGQGFKPPSLYQLYSAYGNLALQPEKANGWDAGVEQHFLDDKLILQATYFGRDVTNLIQFVSCFTSAGLCATHPQGYYLNIARNEAQGLELQGTVRPAEGLELSANYTFDDTEDRSPGSATLDKQLIRRPKNTANGSITYTWPMKASASLAVRWSGQSFDEDFNTGRTVVLQPYVLVDLRASYPIRDGLEIYGRVENLTDKAYETVYQYGTLGRAFYGGIRASF